jgi:hypothetical protein
MHFAAACVADASGAWFFRWDRPRVSYSAQIAHIVNIAHIAQIASIAHIVDIARIAASLCVPLFSLLLLSACSSLAPLAPEKRHSPAEIAAYTVNDFVAPIASNEGERLAREDALAAIREASSLPPGFDPNNVVPGALWNIGFLQTEFALGRRLALESLATLPTKDAAYQRGVLSAAFTWYAADTAPILVTMLDRFTTPREFAMAAYAVDAGFAATADPAQRAFVRSGIRATMRRVFPDWQVGEGEPRLRRLDDMLSSDMRDVIKARPPIIDLLAHPFQAGKPVIYSFQRLDRRRFGVAVVRGADGRFVRNADGSLFHIAHLANAITNLPGTITNGNTPQGLFTIVGAGTATNKWIGPTPYLESKVPVEATRAEFEHRTPTADEKSQNPWTEAVFQAFLPENWRGYWPFMEAYHAGRAGRDEMLIHGTTVSSRYYVGKSYYPGTPSAGCLVAMEVWSEAEGRMLQSDQLALIKAFTRDGIDRGYLVVVEIDDQLTPVALQEVERDILAAERRLGQLAVSAPPAR